MDEASATHMTDFEETPGRVLPEDTQKELVEPMVSSTGTALEDNSELSIKKEDTGVKAVRTFFPNESPATTIAKKTPPSIEHATLGQMADQMQAIARAERQSNGIPPDTEGGIDDDDDMVVVADGEEATGRWTDEEHELFLEALKKYGKEWEKIAGAVRTRTIVQTRTHAQKFFQRVTKGQSSSDIYGGSGGTGDGSGTSLRTSSRTRRPTSVYSKGDVYSSPGAVTATAPSSSTRRGDGTRLEDRLSTDKLATSTPLVAPKAKPPSTAKQVAVFRGGAPQERFGSLATLGVHDDLPQPSPAACGTRKDAELNAAAGLVSSASKGKTASIRTRESDGADALSSLKKAKTRPGEIVRHQRVSVPNLTIENPENLDIDEMGCGSKATRGLPATPWERDIRALTGHGKRHSFAETSVSTPSQQQDFLRKVLRCVQRGDAVGLQAVLQAAEASCGGSDGSPRIPARVNTKPAQNHEGVGGTEGVEAGTKRRAAAVDEASKASKYRAEAKPQDRKESNSGDGDDSGARNGASLMSMALNRQSSGGRSVLYDACSLDSAMFDQHIALNLARLLTESGASSAVVGEGGRTCLHGAAKQGYVEVARLLLKRGCPINAQDSEGNTGYHVAVMHGHGSFLELMADFGANCHIRNKEGRSALDLAGSGSTYSDPDSRAEMRRILLSVEPRLRTLVLYHEDCLEHSPRRPDDWEGPDRLLGIMQRLQNPREFAEHELEISTNFSKAGVDLLSRVHSAEYLAFVDNLSKKMQSDIVKKTRSRLDVVPFTPQVQRELLNQSSNDLKKTEFSDTSFSAGTLHAARRAAGAVAHAVDRVLLGRNRNAFCCVRPPGHHAGYNGLLTSARSCGFCIFNSIAAAAFHALEQHKCERVAIVDLDVHHGNGTEDIVKRYPHPHRLLFTSLHLYDKGVEAEPAEKDYEFFPGSGAAGDNAHNIINVPIQPLWRDAAPVLQNASSSCSSTASSSDGSGGEEFSSISDSGKGRPKEKSGRDKGAGSSSSGSQHGGLEAQGPQTGKEAFRNAVLDRLLPALRAFNPSLILMSTGFDPAYGDVGNTRSAPSDPKITQVGMNLEPEDFSWVTGQIMKIADLCCSGRVVSVLEGGYGSYSTTKEMYPRHKKVTRGDTAKAKEAKAKERGADGAGGEDGGEVPASAKPVPMMNRHILASAATSHVHRLVDPYAAQPENYPLLCVEVAHAAEAKTKRARRKGKGKGKGSRK